MKALLLRTLMVLSFGASLVLAACNQDGSREHPSSTSDNEHPESSHDSDHDRSSNEHPAGEHPN